ncbi:MAG: GlmU family protein [Bacteroidota bacterium]
MKNIILFDSDVREHLLPLTFTRPVCELRVGILTIREKWERALSGKASYITQEYLSDKYEISISQENWVINGSILPNPQLLAEIERLGSDEALLYKDELIAAKLGREQFGLLMKEEDNQELVGREIEGVEIARINRPYDIFRLNHQEIEADFNRITEGRRSQELSSTNQVIGPQDRIFIEPGAKVECAVLNAESGPIYIGKNAVVMEGSLIRGSFALCENAQVKMGAKIYAGTTIGPWSKVGGEVSNSVIQGYSNKGHDGFLGNSVLGEWCNLGADSNNSNLKNNYAEVRLWDYATGSFAKTGLQFCGLIMGDHSKCGINTMFNTGTVVGVGANIFGSGFPRNFIPSFAWGGASGFTTFNVEKAIKTAELVLDRRGKTLSPEERIIFLRVFEDTAQYRRWEKKPE